jgi:hypothetical protein
MTRSSAQSSINADARGTAHKVQVLRCAKNDDMFSTCF